MGVFAQALRGVSVEAQRVTSGQTLAKKGLAVWLIGKLRPQVDSMPRVRILERIRVTPRQVLILVEVEGERLLMGASDGSTPAFHLVKKRATASGPRQVSAIRVEGTCA